MTYSGDKYVNFQYDKTGDQVGRKILNCLDLEYKLINVNSNKALDVSSGSILGYAVDDKIKRSRSKDREDQYLP